MIRPASVLWEPFITHNPLLPGKSCFLVNKGPHDYCTVEQDSYTGEIAVKRIS